jgi:hypothetical protein
MELITAEMFCARKGAKYSDRPCILSLKEREEYEKTNKYRGLQRRMLVKVYFVYCRKLSLTNGEVSTTVYDLDRTKLMFMLHNHFGILRDKSKWDLGSLDELLEGVPYNIPEKYMKSLKAIEMKEIHLAMKIYGLIPSPFEFSDKFHYDSQVVEAIGEFLYKHYSYYFSNADFSDDNSIREVVDGIVERLQGTIWNTELLPYDDPKKSLDRQRG